MLDLLRPQHRLLVPAVVTCLTTGAMSANARAEGAAPVRSDCAARVGELERRYRQVEAEADGSRFLPFPTAFEAPTLLDGSPPEQLNAVLQLSQTGVIFDGRPLEGDPKEPKKLMTAIERELTKSNETWRILHPGKKVPRVRFGLWIDRRVAAPDAAGLLMALSSKYETGVFGMGTRDVAGGRRRALSASVQKRWQEIYTTTDMATKSKLITAAMRDAIGGCPVPEGAFKTDDSGPRDLDSEEQHFHNAILDALKRCACAGVDLDLLEAVTASLADGPVHYRPARPREHANNVMTLTRTATLQEFIDRLPASGPFRVRWEDRRTPSADGK